MGKKDDLDIYLYPQIEFNDNEKIKAIIFMVVGHTGCGKTTLLNSFINYILGIEIEIDFRYENIHENFWNISIYFSGLESYCFLLNKSSKWITTNSNN